MQKRHLEQLIARKRHEMSRVLAAKQPDSGTLARLAGELFDLRERLRLTSGAVMLRQGVMSEHPQLHPTWYIPGYGFVRS
jgi:hypothetical protein